MIKLTNIKTTDTIKQLRGQINTMQNEIMDNQPFVGRAFNPSVKVYSSTEVVATIPKEGMQDNYIYALCFPENNGVFVSKVWGTIYLPSIDKGNKHYGTVEIEIPAIKLPTRNAIISTFVAPEHFDLAVPEVSHEVTNNISHIIEGDTTLYMGISDIYQYSTTCMVRVNVLVLGANTAPTLDQPNMILL